MANGYIRQSSAQIVTGGTINASDFNNEFNAIQQAMDNTLGHTHDGTVAGGGGPLTPTAISPAVAVRGVSLMAWGNIPGTYNNGASGVGATITATGNAALTISGFSVSLSQRILLQGQTNSAQNGIYVVTQIGDATHPYILTRTTDFNSTNNIFDGIVIYIADDSLFSFTAWQLSCANPVVVGTTSLYINNANTTINGNGTGLNAGIGVSWSGAAATLQTVNMQSYLNVNSAITLNTWTKVPFDTIEWDYSGAGITPSGFYDKITNHRYTPNLSFNNIDAAANGLVAPVTSNLGGRYRVSAGVTLSAGTTIGVALYKNGVAYKIVTTPGPAAGNGTVTIDAIVSLNGNTDYVEIFAFDSTTGNIIGGSTATWVSVNFIGTSTFLT